MAGGRKGSWCHIEIPVASPKNAKKFYGELFGWTFRDVPELNYVIFTAGDGAIGGGLWNPPPGIPRLITNYVSVDDVGAMVARVQQYGGKLVNPRTEVPGHGWFALVADPDGNVLGLWQNAAKPAAASRKKRTPKKKHAGRKRK